MRTERKDKGGRWIVSEREEGGEKERCVCERERRRKRKVPFFYRI